MAASSDVKAKLKAVLSADKPAVKSGDHACSEAVKAHLCATQCALIDALAANHELCHELGCCVPDDGAA